MANARNGESPVSFSGGLTLGQYLDQLVAVIDQNSGNMRDAVDKWREAAAEIGMPRELAETLVNTATTARRYARWR